MVRKVLIIIGVVAVFGVSVALAVAGSGGSDKKDSTNSTTKNEGVELKTTDQAPAANTVIYDDNGFNPASLTVKSGTPITITNKSSHALKFSSDPHPAHTDNPELNEDTLAVGQSQTVTPTTTGTHGIHDHNDATKTMTLIVQ